jgi:hypothetical protein
MLILWASQPRLTVVLHGIRVGNNLTDIISPEASYQFDGLEFVTESFVTIFSSFKLGQFGFRTKGKSEFR